MHLCPDFHNFQLRSVNYSEKQDKDALRMALKMPSETDVTPKAISGYNLVWMETLRAPLLLITEKLVRLDVRLNVGSDLGK